MIAGVTTGGWADAILGCWIVAALVIWLVAEAVYHGKRLKRWLERTLGQKHTTYIDQTILQMNDDAAREAQEGSSYRKARHGIEEAKGR